MKSDERLWAVKELLFDYVRSPSLKHIRDPHSLQKLALELVKRLDRGNSLWTKWDGQRELLLKSAIGCWIPVADLREFLNELPGPPLTMTDVTQRLLALEEEDHYAYPKEELQPGCLAIYEAEKADGTELPAIIGRLRAHVEQEEERLRDEQQARYRENREKERIAREQRLLSGADCSWTQLQRSPHWYCRANGRTYRLSPTNIRGPRRCFKGGCTGSLPARTAMVALIADVAHRLLASPLLSAVAPLERLDPPYLSIPTPLPRRG